MMTRKLAFLAVCLAVLPVSAAALGLGDITLQSALNQPLKAEVGIISATADEMLDLSVELASSEAFARANLQRSSLLDNLRFSVIQRTGNTGIIQVSSTDPVQEPFLDFLLQVSWRGGQLVREYTVLVDPPVLMPAQVPRIQAPVTRSESKSTTQATPLAASTAVRSVTPVNLSSVAQPSSYTTVQGDTLWKVALQLRPDKSVTAGQMMIALQRRNPKAFFDNNINQLKIGATLAVPERQEIVSVQPLVANAEVDRQEKAWQEARKPKARQSLDESVQSESSETKPVKAEPEVVIAAQESGAESAETPQTADLASPANEPKTAEPQGRLKLVAPENGDLGQLNLQEMAVGQSEAGQSGIEDPQTRFLSNELAAAIEVAEAQRIESDNLRANLAEMQEQMQGMQRLIAVNEVELVRLQNQLAAAPAETGLDVAPVEPEKSASVRGEIASSSVLQALVAVIATLALALAWVVLRQRRMEQEMLASIAEFPESDDGDSYGKNSAPDDEEAAKQEEAQDPATDPIAEADVYIAYGRYDQAAEMVTGALNTDPGSKDLALKLIEIHYAAKDSRKFDSQAAAFKEKFEPDSAAWENVAQMGLALNPDNPLYWSVEAGTADEIVNEILDELPAEAPAISESVQETGNEANSDAVDWDLDFEATGTDDAEYNWSEAESSGDDSGVIEFEPTVIAQSTADASDAEVDEMDTRLDMARAYIDMGDSGAAGDLLEEVIASGTEPQKQAAEALKQQMS